MYQVISSKDIKDNIIKMISDEYMLITAGDSSDYNMMTASWGMAGELWGNDSVIAFIRPQRYTMEYVEKQDYFTLSFYGDNKNIHKICGSKSGRDCDKTALCSLHPVFSDNSVYFEEARIVLVCKKQYVDKIKPECFIDAEPDKWYPNKDYHYMIIGKIEKVLIKK